MIMDVVGRGNAMGGVKNYLGVEILFIGGQYEQRVSQGME
jgi:hypothetical protein